MEASQHHNLSSAFLAMKAPGVAPSTTHIPPCTSEKLWKALATCSALSYRMQQSVTTNAPALKNSDDSKRGVRGLYCDNLDEVDI